VGYRTNLINKSAAEHLQPGEELEQVAIVRRGSNLSTTAGGSNFAVAASASNVYVLALGGLGFAKVKEVVDRVPIAQAVVKRGSNLLSLGRRGQEHADYDFVAMSGAKGLEEYVAARNGGA
jgi:hypothetical protein